MDIKNFLSQAEQQAIEDAIRQAEQKTNGEIRVHLTHDFEGDILDAAVAIFDQLGMEKTKARNGVLIYICPGKKEFAILGDEGINSKVKADFWDATRDEMLLEFKKGDFAQGIVNGVLRAGKSLQEYFPFTGQKNELENHISFDE